MKKIILILTVLLSINLLAIDKIDFNAVANGTVAHKTDISPNKESASVKKPKNKVKLKKYKKIKELKNLTKFSVMDRSKLAFKELLRNYKLSNEDFKKIFGYDTGSLSVFLSALTYDWLLKKPELAENFYKILLDKYYDDLPIHILDYIADFYLRTGRVKDIKYIIDNKKCMASIKYIKECSYYEGLSEWARTGNLHNTQLTIAKDRYKIVRELFKNY